MSQYMVYAKDISNEGDRKHEIIVFYSSTEAGVVCYNSCHNVL